MRFIPPPMMVPESQFFHPAAFNIAMNQYRAMEYLQQQKQFHEIKVEPEVGSQMFMNSYIALKFTCQI